MKKKKHPKKKKKNKSLKLNSTQLICTNIDYPLEIIQGFFFQKEFTKKVFYDDNYIQYKKFLGSNINIEGSGFQLILKNTTVTINLERLLTSNDEINISFLIKYINNIQINNHYYFDLNFYRNTCENKTFFEIRYKYLPSENYPGLLNIAKMNNFFLVLESYKERILKISSDFSNFKKEINLIKNSRILQFNFVKVLNYYKNWITIVNIIYPKFKVHTENKEGEVGCLYYAIYKGIDYIYKFEKIESNNECSDLFFTVKRKDNYPLFTKYVLFTLKKIEMNKTLLFEQVVLKDVNQPTLMGHIQALYTNLFNGVYKYIIDKKSKSQN